jgi:hypothetical protein
MDDCRQVACIGAAPCLTIWPDKNRPARREVKTGPGTGDFYKDVCKSLGNINRFLLVCVVQVRRPLPHVARRDAGGPDI